MPKIDAQQNVASWVTFLATVRVGGALPVTSDRTAGRQRSKQ